MELSGLSTKQAAIATLLWHCESMEEVDAVINAIGPEAEIVRNLILMESIEEELLEQESFEHIETYLKDIR